MDRNNSPKVAVIARLDQPGGNQSVVTSMIKGLNARGIVPDVIWDLPPSARLMSDKGVQAGHQPVKFPFSSHILDRVPITVRKFLTVFNTFTDRQLSHPYDLYLIFYNGFLVYTNTPHLRYLNGPPLIPQLDLASPGLRGYPHRFLRWLYRTALSRRFPAYEFHRHSPYVINSEYTAQLFEEAHGVRLPVVHPPINLSGRSFTPEDIHQRDTITFLSRFVDYKRPEMVFSLADCYPKYRVVLMGGVKPQNRTYYESLRQDYSSKDRKKVFFFDNPTDAKIKEELARTLFYVFPAVNEHFGIVTAEAIASGAIPFVHDSGGQREVVPDPRLRFRDGSFYEQFTDLLRLSSAERNDIRIALNKHVHQFSEEIFFQKMMSLAHFESIV